MCLWALPPHCYVKCHRHLGTLGEKSQYVSFKYICNSSLLRCEWLFIRLEPLMSVIVVMTLFWQMHYLLYGTGMQTWEYSPLYAIRSYAYLWLHALPACLHAHVLQTSKASLVHLTSRSKVRSSEPSFSFWCCRCWCSTLCDASSRSAAAPVSSISTSEFTVFFHSIT